MPSGRRLVVVVVGLVILAVLAVAISLLAEDEATTDTASTSTTTTASSARAPDVVVARQILPITLGPGWVEVTREPEPVAAEVDPDDACASRAQPIADGLVTRASFDHVQATVTEQASIVAGVVTAGTSVPRLDDAAVIECLRAGLEPQVGDGNDLVVAEQPLPAAPEGAELTGVRFEERDPDRGTVRRFELLLLRRDRAVTFLLVAVSGLESATPLDDLVSALDAPLVAGARRLN